MRRCLSCGRYTLKRECPGCGGGTKSAHPARFSPDDKYARYRLPERYADGGGGATGGAPAAGGGKGKEDGAQGAAAPGGGSKAPGE